MTMNIHRQRTQLEKAIQARSYISREWLDRMSVAELVALRDQLVANPQRRVITRVEG